MLEQNGEDQVEFKAEEMLTEGDAAKYKAQNPRSSAAARRRRKAQRLKRMKKPKKPK